jgi:DNA-directed RNA polymerase subunit beta
MQGLHKVFTEVFPIKDFADKAEIDYVKYELEEPKYDVEECQQRGMTYAAPLRVTMRLSVFDVDEDTGLRSIRDIKEQDVYMVDMPLMTDNGTFVVNGTERVIVSQMHRSARACSLTMMAAKPTHRVNICSPPALFLTAVHGWISNSMPKTICMCVSTVAAKLPVTTLLRALDSDEVR